MRGSQAVALALGLAFSFSGRCLSGVGLLHYGFLAKLDFGDFAGQDLEFSDQMARVEVSEERFIRLAVVVAALNEYAMESAGGNLGRGFAPNLFRAWREGDAVRLYVAEDENFMACMVVTEEEGCTITYADAFVGDAVIAVGGFVAGSAIGGRGVEIMACGVPVAATVVVPPHAGAVTYAPAFNGQTIADLDVALAFAMAEGDITAFCEAHIGH